VKRHHSLASWQEQRSQLNSHSLGFVPTMGALHKGHESLIERSVAENDVTVLSIYVNPTQFNNPRDLETYPKRIEADLERAMGLGVDHVLLPDYAMMYPDGFRYQVMESEFSKQLCGAHREGHFTGVLTVVMKLLNLVQPHRAYFGEKDYQQYCLIRDMAAAFFMDVDIVACPIVREADGLAMSSRNLNLDAPARQIATRLNQLMREIADDETLVRALAGAGFLVDYVTSLDGRRYVAASLEVSDKSVRLIDNMPILSDGETVCNKQEVK